ncbi:hypothetical protein CIB87_12350 [Priestia megaterium]|uniref:Uncharacterized protein n=1 Tax=Priestia megaterium TaxID=1404 RepID=A0AA86I0Q8_PRIMG|nr:hypothetical protein [Priestia megaterium]AXI29763.1 hypothetical protein CIB87_12350 [Priestia megaterium]
MTQHFNKLCLDLEKIKEEIHWSLFSIAEDFPNEKGIEFFSAANADINSGLIELLENSLIEIQEGLKSYINDSRRKYWVEIIFQICTRIQELVSINSEIDTLASFDVQEYQRSNIYIVNHDPDQLDDDFERLGEEGWERKLELAESALEDIYELEETLKQLTALLQAFNIELN